VALAWPLFCFVRCQGGGSCRAPSKRCLLSQGLLPTFTFLRQQETRGCLAVGTWLHCPGHLRSLLHQRCHGEAIEVLWLCLVQRWGGSCRQRWDLGQEALPCSSCSFCGPRSDADLGLLDALPTWRGSAKCGERTSEKKKRRKLKPPSVV